MNRVLKRAIIGGILTLLVCVGVPDVSAATYYVAGDVGDDTRTTVQAQVTTTPWKTIQKAADTMVAGDTVNVKGGVTYTETVTPAVSGSVGGGYITYQAWAGTGVPIIDCESIRSGFVLNARSYIVISSFTIKNPGEYPLGAIMAMDFVSKSNLIIKNNIIYSTGSTYAGIGMMFMLTSNSLVINNVTNKVMTGINFGSLSNNTVTKNNITTNGLVGIGGDNIDVGVTFDNNLSYNNSLVNFNNSSAPNNVSEDPLFVDPANGDYSLQPNSPAINMGADLTASGVTTDILGRARPNAGAFDIGAYEDPNLYVDGNDGNDTNNGAMATPFQTIQKGADVATPGDNVNVKGGITYTGNNPALGSCTGWGGEKAVVCIKSNSGSAGSYITYQAWKGTGTPIIDASSTNDGFGIRKSYIVIDGFEIKNGVSGNNPRGIMIADGITYSSIKNVIIKNNVLRNNFMGIQVASAVAGSLNIALYNNTVNEGSPMYGVLVFNIANFIAKNNIVTNASKAGFYFDSCTGLTVDYNLLYDNTTNYIGVSPGANDLLIDPLLIDSTNGDFRLQKSSPAINAGADLSASGVLTDILGVARPQGASYDIGAYEYYEGAISLTALDPDTTNDTTPTFSGTASTPNGAVSSVSYSVDEGAWSTDGVTGTTSYSITIPSALAEGAHTIRVRATDSNGYTTDSTMYGTDSFTVDTTAPTGTVQVNAGATHTNTTAVTLTLSSVDSAQMKIANTADFAGASWEAYAETKSHTLTTGDGLKTVYVKFKDLAGNQSETVTTTITLDTTKPSTKITDLGLITNVPDKSPLFYYFTSQTPRIKGTTEAMSTVHFKYEDEDYTTTANADGKYEITIPELPRQQVELTYYAVDLAGNQGKNRTLTLVIGVENFPADEVAVEESGTEEEPTPTDGTEQPTPSTTPVLTVYGITVVDANGKALPNTLIYINGQEYRTNEEGKVYLEAKPTEAMEYEVEINGQRVKGTVLGDQIQAEAVQAKSSDQDTRSYSWLWWVLGGFGLLLLIPMLRRKN